MGVCRKGVAKIGELRPIELKTFYVRKAKLGVGDVMFFTRINKCKMSL